MTTQVLFIRHGETDWNRIKRIQGHIDIPLSEHGFLQAEQLGARLAREGRIDAVYSSDLQRAQQTARPSRMLWGSNCVCRKNCASDFTARFKATTATKSTTSFPLNTSNGRRAIPGFSPPGDGESQRVFYHRVVHAMEPIVAAHPGGRIAGRRAWRRARLQL